jgi:competence protein ComGC
LNLVLALSLIILPSLTKNSSDIDQKSNNTTINHRHICRIQKIGLGLHQILYVFEI